MKKGQLQGDFVFYAAMIFVFSVIGIIAFYVADTASDSFNNSTAIPDESKTLISNAATRTKNVNDWNILTLVIGLFIAMILTAYVLRASPALAGISIIIMVIVVAVAIHMANSFYGFSSSSEIQPYSSQFNVTTTIMANLPKFIIFLIAIYIIILYSKGGSSPPI